MPVMPTTPGGAPAQPVYPTFVTDSGQQVVFVPVPFFVDRAQPQLQQLQSQNEGWFHSLGKHVTQLPQTVWSATKKTASAVQSVFTHIRNHVKSMDSKSVAVALMAALLITTSLSELISGMIWMAVWDWGWSEGVCIIAALVTEFVTFISTFLLTSSIVS